MRSNPIGAFAQMLIPYRRQAIAAAVTGFCIMLISLATPKLNQWLIDVVIPAKDIPKIGVFALLYALFYGTMQFAGRYKNRRLALMSHSFTRDLRNRMYEKILTMDLPVLERNLKGNMLSRIMIDAEQVERFYSELIQTLPNLVKVIGVVVMMLSIHTGLTWRLLLLVPPLVLARYMVSKMDQKWMLAMRQSVERLSGIFGEWLEGLSTVQAFHQESATQVTMHAHLQKTREATVRSVVWTRLIGFLFFVCNAAGTFLVYLVGTSLLSSQALTPGIFIAFVAYMGMFWDPVNAASQLYHTYHQALVCAKRIQEVLDAPPSPVRSGKRTLSSVRGELRFENVAFQHDGDGFQLRPTSFTLAAGEHVALSGATGAGKSTIAGLITRLYEPASGAIYLDGCPICELDAAFYAKNVLIVTQDSYLFDGTVRDNLAFIAPNATDAQMMDALRTSGFDDPMMLDLPIAEGGVNLSAGQRQELAITRVLLTDAKVIVFDEATSNFDSVSEQATSRRVLELTKGKTVLTIAHRKSTIARQDRVLTIRAGGLV